MANLAQTAMPVRNLTFPELFRDNYLVFFSVSLVVISLGISLYGLFYRLMSFLMSSFVAHPERRILEVQGT